MPHQCEGKKNGCINCWRGGRNNQQRHPHRSLSLVFCYSSRCEKVGRWKKAELPIKKPQNGRLPRKRFTLAGAFGEPCPSSTSQREVDLVRSLKIDGSLCIRECVLNLERVREKRMRGWEDVSLGAGRGSERRERDRGRHRTGEWRFLQVIFGVSVTAEFPLLPILSGIMYQSQLPVLRKKRQLMKRGTSDSLCLSYTATKTIWVFFSTADQEKKSPLYAEMQTISPFLVLEKDPMLPRPPSVQHNSNLHFLSKKNQHYWSLFFMIQALFCPEFNQFLYKHLSSRGLFQPRTWIDRCSRIRLGLQGTSITVLQRISNSNM